MIDRNEQNIQYYLDCIKSGSKLLSDIDDGPLRKDVRMRMESQLIEGNLDSNSMKSLAMWLKLIKKTSVDGASDEINAKMAALINELE